MERWRLTSPPLHVHLDQASASERVERFSREQDPLSGTHFEGVAYLDRSWRIVAITIAAVARAAQIARATVSDPGSGRPFASRASQLA